MSAADNTSGRVVFVTGGAGFIGTALCASLAAAGHRIVVYDNLSRGRRDLLPAGAALIEGDIRDRPHLERALRAAGPDCLVHLAAMHFIPDCVARPAETLEVNVEGTRQVLESCRGGTIRQVLFASSAAVYAPTDRACVEDETPLGPLEIYGESKLAGESLARAFHEETGVPTAILRLFNAVGPHETNPHVIPHILESLRTSDRVQLGSITPRRDYIDTRDLAAAILAVLGTTGLLVLNVGTGSARSVADVIDDLRAALNRPIAIAQDRRRVRDNERMLLLADLARMHRTTGWRPRIPWQRTLADLIDAYGLRAVASGSG